MKKHIVFAFVLAAFCMAGTFSETKINVTQSIRYGNGNFVPLNTPQISRKSARKEGGKVYLKYDFEVTDKGFFDPSDIYICVKTPDLLGPFIKVTTLSGATDVINTLQGTDSYSKLRNSIGRQPINTGWFIYQRNSDFSLSWKDYFNGIFLKMKNEKGNTAYIELYIDFSPLENLCNDLEKNGYEVGTLGDFFNGEIPIDISFHSQSRIECYIAKGSVDPYYSFDIQLDDFERWRDTFSSSKRSFILLVKE